jgi:hypothetical protein
VARDVSDPSVYLLVERAAGQFIVRLSPEPFYKTFTKPPPFHNVSPLLVLYPEKPSFGWTEFWGAGQKKFPEALYFLWNIQWGESEKKL